MVTPTIPAWHSRESDEGEGRNKYHKDHENHKNALCHRESSMIRQITNKTKSICKPKKMLIALFSNVSEFDYDYTLEPGIILFRSITYI